MYRCTHTYAYACTQVLAWVSAGSRNLHSAAVAWELSVCDKVCLACAVHRVFDMVNYWLWVCTSITRTVSLTRCACRGTSHALMSCSTHCTQFACTVRAVLYTWLAWQPMNRLKRCVMSEIGCMKYITDVMWYYMSLACMLASPDLLTPTSTRITIRVPSVVSPENAPKIHTWLK